MHVLVIKTSSMGDVLHTLPALTDARFVYPDIRFDWVVENSFRQIPATHPAVQQVIPVNFRHWRRHPGQWLGSDVRALIRSLRATHYTHVIDAQGLLKSALVTRLARGSRYGYSFDSARESFSALAYTHRISVSHKLHAILRIRRLFADTLGYPCPDTPPDYGISTDNFSLPDESQPPYVVFVHASTWVTKQWPESYWQRLIELVTTAGYRVRLSWGSNSERAQAQRIVHNKTTAEVLPKLELDQLMGVLAQATAVVAVDTGLGHLTAALGTPSVSIYGATNPELTGTLGQQQHHLLAQFQCSPCLSKRCTYTKPSSVTPACYSTVPPEQVWGTLRPYLEDGKE